MTGTEHQEREQAAEPDQDDDPGKTGALKARFQGWRESIRRRPGLNRIYRIAIGLAGTAIVAAGIVLLPFPGPGWVVIFLGLAVLATEFEWAKRLSRFAREKVSAWTAWLGRQSWPVRVLAGLATVLVVLGAIYLALRITGVPGWVPGSWVRAIPGLSQ